MSSPLTPFENTLLRQQGEYFITVITYLMAQAVTWGMYILVISFSTYLLLKQGIKGSKPRLAMFLVSWIMFLVATAILAVSVAILALRLRSLFMSQGQPGQSVEDKLMPVISTVIKLNILKRGLFAIEVLLGDAVVLWRTWALWGSHRWPMIFPIAFYLATIGSRIAISIRDSTVLKTRNITHAMELELLSIVLSISMNSVCTGMIGFRAWQYRRAIKEALGPAALSTRVNRVFLLLIESGIAYIMFFSIQAIELAPKAVDQQYSAVTVASTVIDGIMGHLMGIYPTVIIILVGLQSTAWSSPAISNPLTSVRFANETRRPISTSHDDVEQHGAVRVELMHGTRTTMSESGSQSGRQDEVAKFQEEKERRA